MQVKTQLWSHQQAALDFALAGARRDAGGHPGAGLWYEMGTGKTLTTLAALARIKARRVLVLAPSVVCNTWAQQVAQHADGFPVCLPLTRGSVAARLERMGETWREHRGEFIAAVNYEAASREPMKSALCKVAWDAVILDEAHRAKGPTTLVSKWAREKLYPCAKTTIALTGTPLPNGYGDCYGLYSAFAPATFTVRNWTHFRNRYAIRGNPRIPQQVTSWQHTAELQAAMQKHAISCRAADVLDLPEAMHEVLWVDLDPATAQAYRQLEADMIAQVEGGEIVASNALVKALRLQQLAGGVAVLDDGTVKQLGTEKADALRDALDGIDKAEPIVCFAQFTADIGSVHAAANAHGRPVFEVSGRVKQVAEWAESATRGEGPIMAAQIAAGGLGINEFVVSRFCFFISTGYSSSAYRQAVARLHRPGQSRKVIYYHVAARGTVDEDVAAALQRKGDLEAAVMERLHVRRFHSEV